MVSLCHEVAILALPNVVTFDLTVPLEIFRDVRRGDGELAYRIRICGPTRTIRTRDLGLRLDHGLELLESVQTIFIAGIYDIDQPIASEVVRALRRASERGARLASICTGAFVLAETGLLAGLRATTHWKAAGDLARRHPSIEVDPNVLFVDEGRLLTSAGATAGIDLCLHLVRRDFGAAAAARAAKLAVIALERAGGQAQFSDLPPPPPEEGSLGPLLEWMQRNLRRKLSLSVLARRSALSTRSLSRRFLEQTGTTPAQWIISARIRRAQVLLETTSHGIDRIADLVGFASSSTLRARFQRMIGMSPVSYRRAFRGTSR